MHKYKHNKLPVPFSDLYTDMINDDELTTRQSEYNHVINPARFRNFSSQTNNFNWNSLELELKATADAEKCKAVNSRSQPYARIGP